MPLLMAKNASQQLPNVASDYPTSAYLIVHPLRQGHLTLLALAQQGLPLLVERRILDVFFVYGDMEPHAVPTEPDPALLRLVIMHTVSYNMWYIVEVADRRHVVQLDGRWH